MDAVLIRLIWRRAKGVCEYCRMPQVVYPTIPFQVDHILARQHGGQTERANLALACLHCNSHKGPNIAGLDPKTHELTRLFNPRRQKWVRHFRWSGPLLAGRTKTGRATVGVLALNDPDLIAVRQALIEEGRFPPRG